MGKGPGEPGEFRPIGAGLPLREVCKEGKSESEPGETGEPGSGLELRCNGGSVLFLLFGTKKGDGFRRLDLMLLLLESATP